MIIERNKSIWLFGLIGNYVVKIIIISEGNDLIVVVYMI
jgi:hypothetical protein